MKHRIFSLASALLLGFAATCAPCALAADNNSSVRADADNAFMQLTLNSKKALKAALNRSKDLDARDLDANGAKFRIESVADPTSEESADVAQAEVETGVKVWFELSDGTKINPLKHEWSARERFYIYVEAAAPVYVWLFHEKQTDKSSAEQSTQIYPDERYPNSVKAIQAGRKTRLPVRFEMDDDSNDEIMSMVVVRADWEGIQSGLTSQAVASVVKDENGSAVVEAEIDQEAHGTLKCLNARVSAKKNLDVKSVKKLVKGLGDDEAQKIADDVNSLESVKFRISEPTVEESDEVEDVCFYMFASQKVGHWRLTIKK